MGVRNSARNASRPLKVPRVSPNEAIKPITVDNTVTMSAISKLVRNASSQVSSANSSWYQRSVQPGGGNSSHWEEPKDSATMRRIGKSKNVATSTLMPPKTYRSAPRRSKFNNMGVSSGCRFAESDEADLHRVNRQRDHKEHQRGGACQAPVEERLDELRNQLCEHHV